tara:strand:- start:643 stop:2514 length:1872 start_codon:yes stop_codon:yes gene_type:complete
MQKLPENWQQSQKEIQANLSPRYIRLDTFERYVNGTQYDGMPGWYDDSVPLLERAPTVVEPMVAKAIESFISLAMGEGRWPTITVKVGENSAFDEALTLTDEGKQILDRGIDNVIDQSRFKEACRKALAAAMGCGTAVSIVCVKDGSLAIESTRAKWCSPTFEKNRPNVVESLEIRYPYMKQYRDKRTGKWKAETLIYRRVVNKFSDITYKPARAHETGDEPDRWAVEMQYDHNFGFCPVVWYAFDRENGSVNEIDGHPVHEYLLDELDCLNRSLSQHDRAALYAGDPQPVEIGVDQDHNPAPTGRMAQPMRHYQGENPAVKEENQKWNIGGSTAVQAGVRKKGPGVVWRYPSKDSKVSFLSLPGNALDAIQQNINDLREQLAEALNWVRIDPSNIKNAIGSAGNLSGRALQWLYRRQTDRCDSIRPDFEDGFMRPTLNMLLRVVLSVVKGEGGQLYLAGQDQLSTVLIQFEKTVGTSDDNVGVRWFSPPLNVQWGEYFEPTAIDSDAINRIVREDLMAGLVTEETAIKKIAPFYNIENPEEYAFKMVTERDHHASGWESALKALDESTSAESKKGAGEKESSVNDLLRGSTTARTYFGPEGGDKSGNGASYSSGNNSGGGSY